MVIRFCKVMGLKPVPILTAMVIFSNIGGGMTPVGDPPNVIIASHRDVVDAVCVQARKVLLILNSILIKA